MIYWKNDRCREEWLKNVISSIPSGSRILDAGAGELKNRPLCEHLDYVSQDFCQYKGKEGEVVSNGLQNDKWDTKNIDIVGDITDIPEPDNSFDVILCSEVFEHIPDPIAAVVEFSRLLKSGGKLIITAPFSSLVHMAPYHFYSGFSKFWYEHHLPVNGFEISELTQNGDWFSMLEQELMRLGSMERSCKNWSWPFAYAYWLLGVIYYKIRSNKRDDGIGCFGWHCLAVKK